MTERTTYTVIALSTEDGDFLVAGVLAGDHHCVDAEPSSLADAGTTFYRFYRFATSVEASDPDEAEELAEKEFREAA